jgi:hypothetical protein
MKFDINEAKQFYADFFLGEHHIPSKIQNWGDGYYVVYRGSLSTYDFNQLTRLVFMAHERGIRVEVAPHGGFGHLKLILHKRDPTSTSMMLGHPTLDEALKRHGMQSALQNKPIHFKEFA